MSRIARITIAALAVLATLTGAASAALDPLDLPVANGANLTRIYRGDDGGALYLRKLGNTVYGFGEHPGRDYAYVLKAAVSGDSIVGKWWDVPKGSRETAGTLTMRWSQLGATLTQASELGPGTFTAISPTGIPWPSMEAAGFQSLGDLDGAFAGNDGSRHYVRETSSDVVWAGELSAQPGVRPDWATVFVGKRLANGNLSGSYVDVPKGLSDRSGSFGAVVNSSKRELKLVQGVHGRTHLTPDFRLDWNLFATDIKNALNGKAVGFAFAIAHNGAILRSDAGGWRRLDIDGGKRPFQTDTYVQTASAAKTVNAAALIKALTERGLTVEAKVAPFLPSCWEKGKDVGTLTFRQLLNHTSGLPLGSGCDADPYGCLVKMIKQGRTEPRVYKYNTHAYDLLRFLVPMVDDVVGTSAWFDGWKCKNTGDILNSKVSERFVRYILYDLLDPVGADASFYRPPDSNFALDYDFRKGKGVQLEGEGMRTDFFEHAGSGKMAMPVLDYVRFLSALDRGLIIPKPLVEDMKGTSGDRLGFDKAYGGQAGSYVWKSGLCHAFESPKVRKCETMAMVFPGDIQAYVAVNSTNNTYSGGLSGVLGSAFDDALLK